MATKMAFSGDHATLFHLHAESTDLMEVVGIDQVMPSPLQADL
jgi:hypothetical protein